MRHGAVIGALALMAFTGVACAEDPPPYDGDPSWSMRALLGYSKTGGNTDNSAGNALFHVAHTLGDWKFLFGAEGQYGSTHGETTSQAFTVHGQANYNFTPKLYGYVGAGYSDDRFSGFAYQDSLISGLGYQIFNDDNTKFTVQGGVGYLWLRKEYLVKDEIGGVTARLDYDPVTGLPYEAEHSIAFNGAANYEHSFNASTKILAGVTVLSSSDNTRTAGNVALQVKMSNRLALAVGYQITNNSKPPANSGKNDSLTTLSLVYDMKNPKLAPE
jgi:putative salt-induced outer membrane protein YdiY